jgi:putative hemolysin
VGSLPRELLIFAELVVILALTVANGVFAGAEIAIVSLRRTRLSQLVEEGRVGAHTVATLRATPERFIATVQIGITVISTTAAAFGGSRMSAHLEPLLRPLPVVGRHANDLAFLIVVALVSYLSLVIGELVPKSLALRYGESYALFIAKPLAALSFVAKPLVWFLTVSSNVILKPFSDRTNFTEARVSREEIEQMVDEAARAGEIHEHASELTSRALRFDQVRLRDAMIPRARIDALPKTAPPDDVRRFLLEERRSRVPVYDGTLDNVIGYVSAKDVVSLAWEGKLFVLSDLLRPIKLFPETVMAIDVLRFMRRERQRIVIAVDEHGLVSGMVTFEDLFEELVGDVFSEDEEEAPPLIIHEPGGTAIVRGEAPVREVNLELGLALEEAEGTTTIAGLCAKLGGGIPNPNARLAAEDGTVLVVLDATLRAVGRVRVIPPPRPEAPIEAAASP